MVKILSLVVLLFLSRIGVVEKKGTAKHYQASVKYVHYANINFSQPNARKQEAPTPYLSVQKERTYENARNNPTSETGYKDWPTSLVVASHREPATIGSHVSPSKGEEWNDSKGRDRSTFVKFFTRTPVDPIKVVSYIPMSKPQAEPRSPIQTDETRVREPNMEPPQDAQLSPREDSEVPKSGTTAAEPLLQYQRGAPQRLVLLNSGPGCSYSNPTYSSQALIR